MDQLSIIAKQTEQTTGKILYGVLPYLRAKKQHASILLNACQAEARYRQEFVDALKELKK